MSMAAIMLASALALAAQDRQAQRGVVEAHRAMERLRTFACEVRVTAAGQQDTYEGECGGEIAHLRGPLEAWCRQDRVAVRSGASWRRPDQLDGEEAIRAAAIRNPLVILAEFAATAARASFDGEEALAAGGGEIACRIVRSTADPRQTEAQIRDFLSRLPRGAATLDLSAIIDAPASRSEYRAWIGREDGRIHRLEWTLEPHFALDRLPQGVPLPPGADEYLRNLRAHYSITFQRFGEPPRPEPPAEVRRLLP